MKIFVKKIDDTLVPELVEVSPKMLRKKKISLRDIYIILEDDDIDLNFIEKELQVRTLLGNI
ncbi:hypothetical protein [Pyrobaculum islandicum]|uniref:hypothetical protein n=1 Tax=Pyrobaculum islandicum TaxID=2277 RepID=UPI00069F6BE4|nr:hypothetical protein [Pyrobaculum islandicum]